jgi:hypothetical protein
MRKWLILMSVVFLPTASAAPAWTWVDENGQVHYSDQPVPGARQIELSGAQTFSAPQRRSTGATQSTPPSAVARYQIAIVSPIADETLWNTGGNLDVRLEVAPQLEAGARIDLLLDGQRLNLNTTSGQINLPNVFRGAHSLQAAIFDAAGRELGRSTAVSFVVQQTSIQNPQNPQRR